MIGDDAKANLIAARMIVASTEVQVRGLMMQSANTVAELRGERIPYDAAAFYALGDSLAAKIAALEGEVPQ